MKELKDLKFKEDGNPKGVLSLLKDINKMIWAFQSESDAEDENIILGLNFIIEDIKDKT